MKKLLLILLLLGCAQPSWTQVAKNDSGTAVAVDAGSVNTVSLTTFTVSAGSNLCLIGFLSTDNLPTAVSMSWDSGGTPQAMTEIDHINNGNTRVTMFRLVNPATGNKTLTASWTTNSTGANIAAIAFSGADQTTCVITADTVKPTGSSTTPSTGAVTSTTDGATVGFTSNGTAFLSGTTTQTQIYRNSSGNWGDGASYALGGTSNTHTWSTAGSVAWAAIGIHIKAAAGSGACGLTLLGVSRAC